MGDTYTQVQSLGIERLRSAYASGGLSLRPRNNDKEEMVKEFARGLGLNAEAIVFKETILQSDAKYLDPQERERWTIRVLMEAVREDLTRTARIGKSSGGPSRKAGPVGFEPTTFGSPRS